MHFILQDELLGHHNFFLTAACTVHARYSLRISTWFFYSPLAILYKSKMKPWNISRALGSQMLRVTKDNLRHENKTSQTIILHTSSTTRISTNIPQLMIRCPRESGLRILINKRSGFTIRNVQKYFHRILFHLVLNLSLSYLMATKRQADLGQNRV